MKAQMDCNWPLSRRRVRRLEAGTTLVHTRPWQAGRDKSRTGYRINSFLSKKKKKSQKGSLYKSLKNDPP